MEMAAAFYFAYKNHMVPFFMAAAVKALKSSDGALNQRNAIVTRAPGHACKAVDVFGGELVGKVRLFCTEHIDRVMRAATQHFHR